MANLLRWVYVALAALGVVLVLGAVARGETWLAMLWGVATIGWAFLAMQWFRRTQVGS